MKANWLGTTLACALLWLSATTFAADAPGVAGVWEYKDPVAVNSITFTLNPDGTGKVDDDACTYTVAGDTIKVVIGGDTVSYTFKLDGDRMTVSGGDLDKPTVFARKNATPKKGLGAKIKAAQTDTQKTKTDAPKADTPKTDTPAADAKPTSKSPIGTWQSADGDQVEIKADAMVYRGVSIPATLTDKSLNISANGQTVECPFDVNGDSMNITIGGQALALKRVGAAPAVEKKADGAADKKPATDAKGLVGSWDGPEGTVVIRPNGTARTSGQEFKYQVDPQYITLSDDKNFVKIPYKLDGDKLVLGTGPTKTLTRSTGGPAGVWVVTESNLDPQFYMSVTHYLSLYPDGTVGFAKTEGGATRTAVTENLERFSTFKNKQGGGGKTYGKWQVDGDGVVTIQWQGAFNNATWKGRVDPNSGKLSMPRAGILNEGATLAYEKQ
jgi:hypothetical protein